MALLAMNAHRLRTSLTMLGIIIGIAAVVSVVALGEGSRRKIMDDIAEIGTNTVEVFPARTSATRGGADPYPAAVGRRCAGARATSTA